MGRARHPEGGAEAEHRDGADPRQQSGGEPYLAGAASPGYAINAKAKNTGGGEEVLAFLDHARGRGDCTRRLTGAITVTTDFEPKLDPALTPIVDDVRAGNVYLPQIAWKRSEDMLNVEATAQTPADGPGQGRRPSRSPHALDTKLASSVDDRGRWCAGPRPTDPSTEGPRGRRRPPATATAGLAPGRTRPAPDLAGGPATQLFLVPIAVVFVVLFVIPLAQTFYWSFTDFTGYSADVSVRRADELPA